MSLAFKPVTEAATVPFLRHQIVDAVQEADPVFFSLLTEHGIEVNAVLAQLADNSQSDVGIGWAAVDGDALVGLVAYASASETRRAQLVSLSHYTKAARDLGSFGKAVRDFALQKQKVDSEAFYLIRIFVSPAWRGTGLSMHLMKRFIDEGRKGRHASLALHVRKENAAASRMYKRLSFQEGPESESFGYRAMSLVIA